MGSTAAATPLQETKPTIKSSYSANSGTHRKGKGDNSNNETKRWKRKPEGGQKAQSSVVPEYTVHDAALSLTKNKSQKTWTRLKAQGSHSHTSGTKTKKLKHKAKKSKIVSPLRSSSSHKTITLSDRENELDNLKELNRINEEKALINSKDNVSVGLSKVQSDLKNVSDGVNFLDNSTTENINVHCFEESCPDSTSKGNLLCENDVPSDPSVNENHKSESNSLFWVVSLSHSDSEVSSDNKDLKESSAEENFSESVIENVEPSVYENVVPSCDEEQINLKDEHIDDEIINSVENILNNNDTIESVTTDSKFHMRPCSGNSERINVENTSPITEEKMGISSHVVFPAEEFQGSESHIELSDIGPKKDDCSSDGVDSFDYDSDSLPKDSEGVCNMSLYNVDESKIQEVTKKKNKNKFECQCLQIIEDLLYKLSQLSKSKCLEHCHKDYSEKSGIESLFDTSKLISINKLIQDSLESFSDSEVVIKSKLVNHLSKTNGFNVKNGMKNIHFKDAACQTSFGNFNGFSGSESGSTCYQNNFFENIPCRKDEVRTARKPCNSFSMGDRLRDVRKLLNRSIESPSEDSFDCNEDGLINCSPNGANETINGSVQYSGENQSNEVVLTSVKRLLNPRETLNRRIAMREWQLVQSGCAPVLDGTWSQFDEGNSWKVSGACDLPLRCAPLHLPPLGNSTPKRLNRRWSPSGGDQVGNTTSAQDDGALSKFCHECGGRYPVAGAKFCCLCGVRRLAI